MEPQTDGGWIPMPERVSAYYTPEDRDFALPLLVTGIGLNQVQYGIDRENGYGCFHFFRCTGGEGSVHAGKQSFVLGRDMGMILYPHEPHSYFPTREPWIVDWITFDGASAPLILSYLEINRSAAFSLPYPRMTESIVRSFGEMLSASKPTVKMDISCRLYELLISLYWNTSTGKNLSRENRYKRIEPALHYIERNYARPLSLELLAGQAGAHAPVPVRQHGPRQPMQAYAAGKPRHGGLRGRRAVRL
jgi:AraC family transcriptional regulator of arabinose operon